MPPVLFETAEGDTFSVVVPALPDLIWGSVAFLIVAVAVYKLAWPTFAATLDERREKIENGLKAADIAKAEVEQERSKLSDQLAQAHIEASELREKAQANAKTIVSDAQAKARSEAENIIAGAHTRIAADADAAKRTLRSDVGAIATNLAERIVGEALADEAMARRVIDRFLDELESGEAAAPSSAVPAGQER